MHENPGAALDPELSLEALGLSSGCYLGCAGVGGGELHDCVLVGGRMYSAPAFAHLQVTDDFCHNFRHDTGAHTCFCSIVLTFSLAACRRNALDMIACGEVPKDSPSDR